MQHATATDHTVPNGFIIAVLRITHTNDDVQVYYNNFGFEICGQITRYMYCDDVNDDDDAPLHLHMSPRLTDFQLFVDHKGCANDLNVKIPKK